MLVDTNVLVDVLEDDPEWADWSIGQLRTQSRVHRLVINPVLPDELDRLHFQVTYRRNTIDLTFTATRLVVQVLADGEEARPVSMEVVGTAPVAA